MGRGYSQDCGLVVQGKVLDTSTQLPLSYVNILVQETSSGAVSDDQGNFTLVGLCPGHYHLQLSHVGCAGVKLHIDLTQDTTLLVELEHTAESLGTVTVVGEADNFSSQGDVSVDRATIEDNADENLSELLQNEAGVSIIKNGSTISKPVVHGLFGNRLPIFNNGIEQAGQQWGLDHSPEIDPFAADRISVIKGVSAIEYGSGNLGSVVLVEPKRIPFEPHLHGKVNYLYAGNGRGHNLNVRLEKHDSFLAWRISGTLKKAGDRRTPNYFLKNTGVEEANLAVQLEKSWNDKFFSELYLSSFNTRLGVLKGSHISNTTDLEEALARDVPFFTEPNFSYSLEAPKQHVSHYLGLLKNRYFFNDAQSLEWVLAAQLNSRKEFDVRRGGRTEIPALNLLQFTLRSNLKYSQSFENDWSIKAGMQNAVVDNTNNPETGILPLIPDYRTFKNGFFLTGSKKINHIHLNAGLRYDYEKQDVRAFSSTVPIEVIRYDNNFHNIGGMFAAKYDISERQEITASLGYAMRNPAINELYSGGLHQGVSGIEEGDPNLETEKALKSTLEYKWLLNTNLVFSGLAYHHHFTDYIFLKPTGDVRLTIRGAFPVFVYEQTNANIYGLDVSTQFTVNRTLAGTVKYSYLKGRDAENKEALVFMPSNRIYGSLALRGKKAFKLTEKIRIEDSELEINNKIVFNRKDIRSDQDFVLPPATYNLVGMKLSTNVIFRNYKLRCFVKADNVLNTEYRDYLNRLRYFADDQGISVSAGVNFQF